MWIATSERSRDIDRQTTDQFGVSTRVLMERAGLSVFDAVKDYLAPGAKFIVLCGHGNNGGDGFVVARLGHEAGYHVCCLVAAEEADLTEAAREQLMIMRAQGAHAIFPSEPKWQIKADHLGCVDLIVDALLGTGAHGEVKGRVKDLIQASNKAGVPVVSVDVPSGIDCDTGEELGESVWAMRTVSFGLPKPFMFQGIGLEHCGYWTVADIGFPPALLMEPTEAKLIDEDWVGCLLPERLRASNKGDNGSVLIVAGSSKMPGAATLAAKSALRAGAGLVTVAAIESVCRSVAAQVPEALLFPLPDHDGVISADAARMLLDQQSRYHAAVFGPGLTHEQPICDFLERVFKDWQTACCIDADALNAVSMGVQLPKTDCVLTPHPGEMSRLLHSSIAEIQCDRFRTVNQAVEVLDKTVLLKGPYSIVGERFQPMLVNCTGNSGMASAGMGDVLSGVVVALLGQDLPAYYAASCGMYWHGAAGDICAEEIGPIGYTAIDVANALPKARARIVSRCDEN
ncbi:MAG TPA: NAD(P)H-hydrate dehydratase [Fimbriimonadaceae bacterium]|jgi:NAD(P)H-hydrate epimerase